MYSNVGASPSFNGRLKVTEVIALMPNGKPIVKEFTVHTAPTEDIFLAGKADKLTGGEKMGRTEIAADEAKRLYSWVADTLGKYFKAPEKTVMVNAANVKPRYDKYVSLRSAEKAKVGDISLKFDLGEA